MDRLLEMEAFAAIVDQGGFTQAARKLGVSKSAVSKSLASLEGRLGARLLNRTTRRVSPTEIGLVYYDRIRRVIDEASEADTLVSSMQRAPSGTLRISVASDFGTGHLAPIIGDFIHAYPDIAVTIVLHNRYVELISEDFDMAIRAGDMEDSSLIARKLTVASKRMVASPGYFKRFGRPNGLDALGAHKLLHYTDRANGNFWKITSSSGEQRIIRSGGWLCVNDNASLLGAAVAGLGIAYLPTALVKEAMDDGLLEDALPDLPLQAESIYAVYPPGRYPQPKVRAFVDFLTRNFARPTSNAA